MNENVTVCITPKGDKPVLHFSQFDNERVFTVTVLADDGETAADLTGLDIEFRLRKTDSHVVTIASESVVANVITFKTTEQMCACCGQNISSVVLMKDDMIISTLDILVDIQRDILSGGLTSASDINNLTTQIGQIVPVVIGNDYYNKTEVDALLAEHTFDPTNYYDKSDVDGLLADKADSDDVYTKLETDNLLSAKADADDVYTKAETDNLLADKADSDDVYTKIETDNLLADKADADDVYTKAEVDTELAKKVDKTSITSLIVQKDVAKSSIASFDTDLTDTLTKCIVDVDENVSGISTVNIVMCGVNLCYQVISGASISGGGQIVSEPSYAMGCALLKKGVTYTVTTQEGQLVGGYFSSSPTIGSTAYDNTRFVLSNKTITPAIDCYIAFRMPANYTTQPQVNIGSTALPYVAYNGQTYTVSLGSTYYDGGILDVVKGIFTPDGASPESVTPVDIPCLNGQNNVYSDSGDTSVRFTETIGNELGV